MKRNPRLSFNHELTFATSRRNRWRNRLFVTLASPLLAVGLAYVLWNELQPQTPNAPPAAPDSAAPALQPVPAPVPKPPVVKVDIAYTVRPKDTLGEIFQRLKLDVADVPAILDIPVVRRKFRPLMPGDKLVFTLEDSKLRRLVRRLGDTETLSITRRADGFSAEVVVTPIEVRTAQISEIIDPTRFAAGHTVGLSAEMLGRLVNEIFAWDVDFALDVRPGDRLNVVYEQKYRNGEYLGDGRIVAAEFSAGDVVHRAVRYTSSDGRIDGYFTPDGRSVRRQFLRAPIDVRQTIPSVDPERRQPVLHTMSNHVGIDYPAPVGASVRATADGRVSFIGVDREYGNTVKIDHGGSITTRYAHLSGFARGVQLNRRVKQGDIIGYVGASGAATAPHLHYEYRVNGIYTDPRTLDLPTAAAIPAEYLADFRAKSTDLLDMLDGPDATVVTAALAN